MKPETTVNNTNTPHALSDNGVIAMWILATGLVAGGLLPALSALEKLLHGNGAAAKLCSGIRSSVEGVLRGHRLTDVPEDADAHIKVMKDTAALFSIVPDDRLGLDVTARNRLWTRCFAAANTGSIDPSLLEDGNLSPAECADAISCCAEKAGMWDKVLGGSVPDAAIIAEELRELNTFAEGIRDVKEEAPEEWTRHTMRIPETWEAAVYLECYPDTERAKEQTALLKERCGNLCFDSEEAEEAAMREYSYTGEMYPALLTYSFVTGLYTAEFYRLIKYVYCRFPVVKPYLYGDSIQLFDPESDDAGIYDYDCEGLSLPDLVTRVRMRSLKKAAARNGFSEEALRKAAAVSAYLPDRHGDITPEGDAEAWMRCMELAATMKVADDGPYDPDIRECIDLLGRYFNRTDEWLKTYHPEVYEPGEIEDADVDDIVTVWARLDRLRENLAKISG